MDFCKHAVGYLMNHVATNYTTINNDLNDIKEVTIAIYRVLLMSLPHVTGVHTRNARDIKLNYATKFSEVYS